MHSIFQRHTRRPAVRGSSIALLISVGLALSGCKSAQPATETGNTELDAFVALMAPRKIELQHSLTRPQAFDATGNQNGIEVVLAVSDMLGDEIKAAGTFNFELYAERPASGDRFGKRYGFWSVKVESEEGLREYWDRWSRFYRFRLQLDERTLPPGRYILTAQYQGPVGDRLFDEYTFTFDGMQPSTASR